MVRRFNLEARSSVRRTPVRWTAIALTITRSAQRMSSSRKASNARSTKRIFQWAGQSAATVMSPSGGTRERSGTICITSPRLQNEAGKLGHTIRTLTAGPSGGKTLVSLGSQSMNKPSYRHLFFDFKSDSLSDANQLCEDRRVWLAWKE